MITGNFTCGSPESSGASAAAKQRKRNARQEDTRKELVMAEAWKEGDRYRCPMEECACEIEVVKGPREYPKAGDNPQSPKCICGCEMVKV